MLISSSSKPPSKHLRVPLSFLFHLLREQRLLFVIGSTLIASTFFLHSSHCALSAFSDHCGPLLNPYVVLRPQNHISSSSSSVPLLALRPRQKHIVVTGGAGFIGSHLFGRLIKRGDSVILLDNFFTGRKENVALHFGNPRFELIGHDVFDPILLSPRGRSDLSYGLRR